MRKERKRKGDDSPNFDVLVLSEGLQDVFSSDTERAESVEN